MTEKMREEFEAWAKSHDWPIVIGSAGCYREIQVDAMWQAWQASRASLVIELPASVVDWSTDNWAEGYNMACKRCIEAIESQGVKVK